MNSVEKVKAICKERKIPISRLERDLGFSNGYIRGLREGKFPSDRIKAIAEYLNVPITYLINSDPEDVEKIFDVVNKHPETLASKSTDTLEPVPEMDAIYFSLGAKAKEKGLSDEQVENIMKIIDSMEGQKK